jgi:hypothetical protein
MCPLDERLSLQPGLIYNTGYFRTDANKHARWVPVRISAAEGLSATDEFYLWGLLALAFSQSQPSLELWATPHWCLRNLGCLDSSKGGENYASFRQVLRRLAGVTYFCDRFWDPKRGEERSRAFGLLKYDLPPSDNSSRAWRLVWDPLFAEYVQARGGKMQFDLTTYKTLAPASRRLFLLLTKIFWRRATSPRFDVWHLCVHTLGFAPSVAMWNLKAKLVRTLTDLLDIGVIALPAGASRPQDLFEKKGTGSYALTLDRGPYFTSPDRISLLVGQIAGANSPLYDPLKTIGFDDRAIRRIIGAYRPNLVQVWADVTISAIESKAQGFFRSSPQAYLLDNLKHAAVGRRTPPDWYRELKKRQAERAQQSLTESHEDEQLDMRDAWDQARAQAFRAYVQERVSKTEYDQRVTEFYEIYSATAPHDQALEDAASEAERHFAAGFEFPEFKTWLRDRI